LPPRGAFLVADRRYLRCLYIWLCKCVRPSVRPSVASVTLGTSMGTHHGNRDARRTRRRALPRWRVVHVAAPTHRPLNRRILLLHFRPARQRIRAHQHRQTRASPPHTHAAPVNSSSSLFLPKGCPERAHSGNDAKLLQKRRGAPVDKAGRLRSTHRWPARRVGKSASSLFVRLGAVQEHVTSRRRRTHDGQVFGGRSASRASAWAVRVHTPSLLQNSGSPLRTDPAAASPT
jgi:hypothetical protein